MSADYRNLIISRENLDIVSDVYFAKYGRYCIHDAYHAEYNGVNIYMVYSTSFDYLDIVDCDDDFKFNRNLALLSQSDCGSTIDLKYFTTLDGKVHCSDISISDDFVYGDDCPEADKEFYDTLKLIFDTMKIESDIETIKQIGKVYVGFKFNPPEDLLNSKLIQFKKIN